MQAIVTTVLGAMARAALGGGLGGALTWAAIFLARPSMPIDEAVLLLLLGAAVGAAVAMAAMARARRRRRR